MTFAELKTELAARGFEHLSTSRQGQFLNDAMHELDDEEHWPYREASGTGVAPVEVPQLGMIEIVMDEDNDVPLTPAQFGLLAEQYGDLSISGTPEFYYVAWPGDVPVVATYPTSSSVTIGVQYWAVASDMSADSDTPLAPSRFHNIILLIAQRMAENERGNQAAAQGLQAEIDRQLIRMRRALLDGMQAQGPADYVRLTYSSDDY